MTQSDHDKDEPTTEDNPLTKAVEGLRDTAEEAEVAAWETVYEARDLTQDVVKKIKDLAGDDPEAEAGGH